MTNTMEGEIVPVVSLSDFRSRIPFFIAQARMGCQYGVYSRSTLIGMIVPGDQATGRRILPRQLRDLPIKKWRSFQIISANVVVAGLRPPTPLEVQHTWPAIERATQGELAKVRKQKQRHA